MSKTLMVYLAADTDRFRREMRSAENQIDSFGGKSSGLGAMVGNAGTMLAGAAVAAGAFAVALGVNAVQAAMDEEAALAKMNTTLGNLGFASSAGEVSAFIDELMYAYNVADSDLRPAFERLAIATGSVSGAQKALRLALDVSAGSGKSLEAVANAMGKAYEGNTGALGRLGTGLDKATLKTGDMDAITAELADTFEGQAAVAASTLEGGLKGVKIATDELIEAFGTGLIDGLTSAGGGTEEFEQTLRDMGESASDVGRFIGGALVAAFYAISLQVRSVGTAVSILDKGWIGLSYALGKISESEYKARMALADANIAFNDQKLAADALSLSQAALSMFASDTNSAFEYQQYAAYGDKKALKDLTEETDDQEDSQDRTGRAVDRTNDAMDRQRTKTQELTSDLDAATQQVKGWTDQINTYRDSITSNITGDLSTVLGEAFGQQGDEGGKTLIEKFREQMTNSENFAGLLEQMKSSGASQSMIDAIAGMGPEMGSQLAQQMLNEGLVKTMSEEWEATRLKIYDITSTLIPDFMKIGQTGALKMLEETQKEIAASEKKLRKIGADFGEPIGAELKSKIAAATSAAIAAAQAAAAAATIRVNVEPTTTPTGSPAPTGPGATGRATVTSLDNLITQNNARGGNVGSSILVLA